MGGKLDRWLEQRGLNPFGDKPDTNYSGGTPLFDERTGKAEDRHEHVRRKHPDAPPPEPAQPKRR